MTFKLTHLRPLHTLNRSISRPIATPINPARYYGTQGYGDGKGDPKAEDPQKQPASNDTKHDGEHPGPPPPEAGRGTGGGPTKASGSTSGSKPEDASAESGGSRSQEAKETGSSPTDSGPRPMIHDAEGDGPGSEAKKAEVEQHNREFEMRHERAPKAEDDKVGKKFWKGLNIFLCTIAWILLMVSRSGRCRSGCLMWMFGGWG